MDPNASVRIHSARPTSAPNDLPVVISGPGDYAARDGRRITIRDVKLPSEPGSTMFGASGSIWREFRGKVRPHGHGTWHVSGRRMPLDETPSDVVGPWVETASDHAGDGVGGKPDLVAPSKV